MAVTLSEVVLHPPRQKTATRPKRIGKVRSIRKRIVQKNLW